MEVEAEGIQSFGQDDILYFPWPISQYLCNAQRKDEERQTDFSSS